MGIIFFSKSCSGKLNEVSGARSITEGSSMTCSIFCICQILKRYIMHRVMVILLKIQKVTLVTSAFFPVMGFEESCDLQARPLGHAITVRDKETKGQKRPKT